MNRCRLEVHSPGDFSGRCFCQHEFNQLFLAQWQRVNGVALIETLKVIGEKGVRITPEVMASGGNGDGAGGLGTLLLLNLFRDQMKKNGSEK